MPPAKSKAPNRTATRKPATKVAPRRNAGDAIIRQAVKTIFPMPPDANPQETEGVLRGFAAALDAVGYDYRKASNG